MGGKEEESDERRSKAETGKQEGWLILELGGFLCGGKGPDRRNQVSILRVTDRQHESEQRSLIIIIPLRE